MSEESNEKVYTESASSWSNLLGVVEQIIGLTMIFLGLIINIIQMMSGFSGLITFSQFFGIFLTQFIPAIIIGIFIFSIGSGIKESEIWAFAWVIYGNFISIAVILILINGIYSYVCIAFLIPVILLFTPPVREYWWDLFVEDFKPRIKETKYSLYLIRKSPLVLIGVSIIIFYVAIAFLAPFLVHYGTNPYTTPINADHIREAPNSTYWFGTDQLGSDIYSMIIWGAQIDLRIAISVVAVGIVIGALLGAVAGYYGGWLDEVLMRITDIFFAFPGLILAMAVVALLGGRSLENVSVALMIVWWPVYARLVRGQVLTEREKLYIEAARSVGASDFRILIFHILPNSIQPVIVQATLDFGGVLLTAAGLSFIGYGAEPGTAEWGLMISTGQRNFSDWWLTLFPGLAILFIALAFNLVGDGIRDIMDPKLRRR